MAGVRVRPALLQDAREHVLCSLPVGANEEEAERLSVFYTRDFLLRIRKKRYRRVSPDADVGVVVPLEWRYRLFNMLDPIAQMVLRDHFGDGYPLAAVERGARYNSRALLHGREQVRAAVRALLGAEGIELSSWSEKRLDWMIRRIANQAEARCPGPGGLLSPAGEHHATQCPRCSRALRLIRWGTISPNDLFLKENQQPLETHTSKLLAILLHPDGRRHHAAVSEALGDAISVGRDCWLVAADDLSNIQQSLSMLARLNSPPRHLLRGALVEGVGRWSQQFLLGPLPIFAIEAARARPWAEIDGIGELPPPLPPAPRATRWWAAVALIGSLAALAGSHALQPQVQTAACPVQAQFDLFDDGVVVRFDTDDLAYVDIVAQEADGVRLIAWAASADKGSWATGEGDYRLVVPDAERLLIISSPEVVSELPMLLEAGQASSLDVLASQVQALAPAADVILSPPPPEPQLPPMGGEG